MFAPDPVEPFLGHAQCDDDIHVVAVVLLACVLQRGGNPVALGRVVIDQIGDPKDSVLRRFDELESRHRVGALPRSEEHTSELQSLMRNSYAVFCLKKKITRIHPYYN